jgi:hypothetical protein
MRTLWILFIAAGLALTTSPWLPVIALAGDTLKRGGL